MLMLRHFVVLFPVVFTEFRIAVFHRVGSFNQVVAKESVAGTNAFGIFGLKATGLMFTPCQACIFGHSSLIVEAFNIANLSENAGGVHTINAGDRAQALSARDAIQNTFNRFVQLFESGLWILRMAWMDVPSTRSMESSTTLERR